MRRVDWDGTPDSGLGEERHFISCTTKLCFCVHSPLARAPLYRIPMALARGCLFTLTLCPMWDLTPWPMCPWQALHHRSLHREAIPHLQRGVDDAVVLFGAEHPFTVTSRDLLTDARLAATEGGP